MGVKVKRWSGGGERRGRDWIVNREHRDLRIEERTYQQLKESACHSSPKSQFCSIMFVISGNDLGFNTDL